MKFDDLNVKFDSLFDVTSEGKEFVTLESLMEEYGKEPIVVRGFFINTKSKYGANPIAILDDALVNLPKHLTDTVTDIMASEELVDGVNAGKCGISIYSYENKKYGGTCYSVKFVDM